MPQVQDVIEYSIYCDTEAAWVTDWLPDPPTQCPNNAAHTVSSTKHVRRRVRMCADLILWQRPDEYANVRTDTRLTTLNLRDDATNSEILRGNMVSSMVWTSPKYPIALAGMIMSPNNLQANDKIDMWIGKDTVVGVLAAPLTSGDNILSLFNALPVPTSPLFTGMEVALFDGVTRFDLGEIDDIKTSTSQVLTSIAVTSNWAAGTTYVLVSIRAVKDLYLGVCGAGGVIELGAMTPGSMVIHPETPCFTQYTSNHPQDERLRVLFEQQYGSRDQGLIP